MGKLVALLAARYPGCTKQRMAILHPMRHGVLASLMESELPGMDGFRAYAPLQLCRLRLPSLTPLRSIVKSHPLLTGTTPLHLRCSLDPPMNRSKHDCDDEPHRGVSRRNRAGITLTGR